MRALTGLAAIAATVALSGCTTSRSSARQHSGGPTLVYEPASERALADRSAELQQNGYSKANADRKARQESAARAWRQDDSQAWARERDREARSAAREKMEKELAKLDAK